MCAFLLTKKSLVACDACLVSANYQKGVPLRFAREGAAVPQSVSVRNEMQANALLHQTCVQSEGDVANVNVRTLQLVN